MYFLICHLFYQWTNAKDEICHLHGRAVRDERTGLGDHSVKEPLNIFQGRIKVKDILTDYCKMFGLVRWRQIGD